MQTTDEQKLHTDHDLYSEAKMIQDFIAHMKLNDSCEGEDNEVIDNHEGEDDEDNDDDDDDEEGEEDDDEEEEFSFTFEGGNTPSIEAEDSLMKGQIMPVFPLFKRDLFLSGEDLNSLQENFPKKLPVKKVFVETNHGDESHLVTSSTSGSDDIAGPCCEWTGKPPVEASSVACKKSNSTGFSKFWRLKDFVGRSSSDGKDTFVFLNKSHAPPRAVVKRRSREVGPSSPKAEQMKVRKSGKGRAAPLSAHAVYLKNKAKHEDKRRSYLPYRPELMGFFTNANVGFTKNVHPY